MIGVNASLFESNGYKARLKRYAADGVIGDLETQFRKVYEDADDSNANHFTYIAAFTIN